MAAKGKLGKGKAAVGSGGICSRIFDDAVNGLRTVDTFGLGGAVGAAVIRGEDGAVDAATCETESRRFSFVRKLRHPADVFSFSSLSSSACPFASPFTLAVGRAAIGAVAVKEDRSALTDRECLKELKKPPEVVGAVVGDVAAETGMGGGVGSGCGAPMGEVSLDGFVSGTEGDGGGEPRGTSVVRPKGVSTRIGILGEGGPLPILASSGISFEIGTVGSGRRPRASRSKSTA